MVDYRLFSLGENQPDFYFFDIFIVKGYIMDENSFRIFIEIFGYIGTALVIISMTMRSMFKLRVINICGGVISAIYSAYFGAWAVVIMNICLVTINIFHVTSELCRRRRERKAAKPQEP